MKKPNFFRTRYDFSKPISYFSKWEFNSYENFYGSLNNLETCCYEMTYKCRLVILIKINGKIIGSIEGLNNLVVDHDIEILEILLYIINIYTSKKKQLK